MGVNIIPAHWCSITDGRLYFSFYTYMHIYANVFRVIVVGAPSESPVTKLVKKTTTLWG